MSLHSSPTIEERIAAVLQSDRMIDRSRLKEIDIEALTAVSDGEIIDRFLRCDDYRIIADENASDDEVQTEAIFDDSDEDVSEELAEVYASQGLISEAIAIYSKLSLLNSEKSVYFAEQIADLTKKIK